MSSESLISPTYQNSEAEELDTKTEYSHMDKTTSWLRFLRAKKLQYPRMTEQQIIDKFLPEWKANMDKF